VRSKEFQGGKGTKQRLGKENNLLSRHATRRGGKKDSSTITWGSVEHRGKMDFMGSNHFLWK